MSQNGRVRVMALAPDPCLTLLGLMYANLACVHYCRQRVKWGGGSTS